MLTPLLTQWLASAYVRVDGWALFFDTVKVVLAPIVLGLGLNRWTPGLVRAVLPAAPLISVLTIAMICASVIGQQADTIRRSGGVLLLAGAVAYNTLLAQESSAPHRERRLSQPAL